MTDRSRTCERLIDANTLSRLAIIDCARMAHCDSLAIASGIASFQLMEQAARVVVSAMCNLWSPRAVAILCGPGNNGGDGYAIGWMLRDLGWSVRLFALTAPATEDARHHAGRWGQAVGDLAVFHPQANELVVDALFGAGLTRPLAGAALQALVRCVDQQAMLVAVDVPSGLHGDTGQVWGFVAPATLTVTFARPKPAHLLRPGREMCGDLVIGDIGISDAMVTQCRPMLWRNEPALWRLPMPNAADHKFSRGHVLLIGSAETSGAIRLAARAARRAGVGLASVAAPAEALPLYGADQPGLMLRPIAGGQDVAALLADPRINQLVIGPGLGRGAWARDCAEAALAAARPAVLDADLFSLFAGAPTQLAHAIQAPAILTPHLGEFERVFGPMAGDRLGAVRCAAAQTGCVIVLKGADSLIAHPDGRVILNDHASPYLATAGSGDVLAGTIAGLMAQGMAPFDAAAAGVWLHGAAGRHCGRGLIAEDLPEAIPQVWPV